MIKIEHSVFALPFALIGAFWAAKGLPELRVLGLILLAMVTARSSAMAFNRYLDAEIDARNPRTVSRSIPAGRLSRPFALGFTVVMALAFVVVTAFINRLTLLLSPVLLLVLLGYSITKRFTSMSHLVLGLALGLAPVGAWVAVKGQLAWEPLWVCLLVLTWTAGFDIIYACQDLDFDRRAGLHSIPARLGLMGSLRLSRVLHLIALTIMVYLGYRYFQHWIYWAGVLCAALCLGYEHKLVWRGDLSKADMAFFTMNGAVSLLYGVGTLWAILGQNL
ncbi:MAG: putative 4-hydroxybenzoate polyprenyltransferase [Acidobacteria bacterium]|nr:putative 4-hydroxybenzoate polyprenyltransferase [Acidobacteriota bacterium]